MDCFSVSAVFYLLPPNPPKSPFYAFFNEKLEGASGLWIIPFIIAFKCVFNDAFRLSKHSNNSLIGIEIIININYMEAKLYIVLKMYCYGQTPPNREVWSS